MGCYENDCESETLYPHVSWSGRLRCALHYSAATSFSDAEFLTLLIFTLCVFLIVILDVCDAEHACGEPDVT